eukprot:835752_1
MPMSELVANNYKNSVSSTTSGDIPLPQWVQELRERSDFEEICRITPDSTAVHHSNPNNVMYSTLLGRDQLFHIEIHFSEELQEIRAVFGIGAKMTGHINVVHGGITALLFDNTLGRLFNRCTNLRGVTASLNINYKLPMTSERFVLLKGTVTKQERRKVFLDATMENGSGLMYSDASALFIILKDQNWEHNPTEVTRNS